MPGNSDAGIPEGENVFFAVGHVPHRAQNKSQCAAQQRDQAVVRRVGRVEKCITVRCQSLLVQESNHEDGQDGTDDLDAPAASLYFLYCRTAKWLGLLASSSSNIRST